MIYALPLLGLVTGAAADPKSCPADTPLSCHNNGPVNDTCCFIPTGLLVQTQFWDTAPATGPKGIMQNKWSIIYDTLANDGSTRLVDYPRPVAR